MKLGEKQELFSICIAKLILWAYENGYQIRCGDFFARERNPLEHKKGSLHYQKLAADLNLFRDGEFLKETSDHKPLGEYWESLHPLCVWGGKFSKPDGNHYQIGLG